MENKNNKSGCGGPNKTKKQSPITQIKPQGHDVYTAQNNQLRRLESGGSNLQTKEIRKPKKKKTGRSTSINACHSLPLSHTHTHVCFFNATT